MSRPALKCVKVVVGWEVMDLDLKSWEWCPKPSKLAMLVVAACTFVGGSDSTSIVAWLIRTLCAEPQMRCSF